MLYADDLPDIQRRVEAAGRTNRKTDLRLSGRPSLPFPRPRRLRAGGLVEEVAAMFPGLQQYRQTCGKDREDRGVNAGAIVVVIGGHVVVRKLKLQVQITVDGFVGGPEGQLYWMTLMEP